MAMMIEDGYKILGNILGMKPPIKVAVTGAAGQIGYSLLFRIASGQMLGQNQPVALSLLELSQALPALEGVVMELEDCAFPLLADVSMSSDPEAGFAEAQVAMLVGALPRREGMERADLLEANAKIFTVQGRALAVSASPQVKVVVVGNPANTNALIAAASAPSLNPDQFTAMTRLDHNRALSKLASRLGVGVAEISRMTIWGNHSSTQYPDLFHCQVGGRSAWEAVADPDWVRDSFIPQVAGRGAEIIRARGASSAASAANAAVDHVRDWVLETPTDDWVSMGVRSDGSYGIPEGLVCSVPVRCQQGQWEIVPDLEWDPFSRERIMASVEELSNERKTVQELGLI